MKNSIVMAGAVVAVLGAAGAVLLSATPRSHVLQPTQTLNPTLTPTPTPMSSPTPVLTPTYQPGDTTDNSIPGNSTASTWSTFTNPQGLYSIDYPNNIGALSVEYTTRGAVLSWKDLDGGFDVQIGPTNIQDVSLKQWLVKQHAGVPSETISINGMSGVVYIDPHGWDTRAYLTRTINGSSFVYVIDFDCYGGEQQCSPAPFWRQMLNSFRGLPANG